MRSNQNVVAAVLAFVVLLAPAAAQLDVKLTDAVATVAEVIMHSSQMGVPGGSRKLAATFTCPAPSTSALTCNTGNLLVSYPSSGGTCNCNCGVNSYVATDSTANGMSTIFPASSTTGCTNALCTSTYPSFCPANQYVNALFIPWTLMGALAGSMFSLTPTNCGSAAICYGIQITCNSANVNSGICPSFMSGTTIFTSGCWNSTTTSPSTTAAAQCTAAITGANAQAGTSAVVCSTTNCNTAAAAATSAANTLAKPAASVIALLATVAAAFM